MNKYRITFRDATNLGAEKVSAHKMDHCHENTQSIRQSLMELFGSIR